MAEERLELDFDYVYSAMGEQIAPAPKHIIVVSPWIMCDYIEDVEGDVFIYPIDAGQEGEGSLFETAKEKYPLDLTPSQVKKVKKWLRQGKGFAIAMSYQGFRVIAVPIPPLYKREIKPVSNE